MRLLILSSLVALTIGVAPALAADPEGDATMAAFAAESLKTMNAAQDEILELKGPELDLAVLTAGGALNEKFSALGQYVQEGKISTLELYQAMALATERLANLAGEAGYTNAGNCHSLEFQALLKMAAGGGGEQQHCRRQAYGSEMQSRAMKIAYGPRAKVIDDLTNTWATHTVLLAERTVRLGRK